MKNFEFYALLGFAVLGVTLAITNPAGLTLVYADIERGVNYDKEILQTFPDGSQEIKWTSQPERILDGTGNYQDYLFSENVNKLIIESAGASVTLDKNTCAFEFHNGGFISDNPNSLFIDSLIPFNSIVDLYQWNEVTQISGATCEAYYDMGNNSLVAKRYADGVGYMEYKYIFTNGKFKTQLEATNLSGLDNRVFGFDQTVDLKRDTIHYGGAQRNLDNFHQSLFDRNWLENNEGKFINFLNGINFDFDIGFDNLDSVYVEDTGANSSKLVFHYMRNNEILPNNETLIIDPTFGYSYGDYYKVQTDPQNDSNCSNTNYSEWLSPWEISLEIPHASNRCSTLAIQYDTTSIGDGATITDTIFKFDNTEYSGSWVQSCEYMQMDHAGSYYGNGTQGLWDDIQNGTSYGTDTQCQSDGTSQTFDLGTNADTDVKNALSDDHFTLGIKPATMSRDGTNRYVSIDNAQIQITYTVPPLNPPTSLSCDGAPYGYDCNWTAPVNASSVTGYYIATSIDSIVWAGANVTLLGNVTSNISSGFEINESNYIRVNATNGLNSTSTNIVFQTTDVLPDAPSLVLSPVNETNIDVLRTAGASDGGDSIVKYDLRCEENGAGGWINEVVNGTIINYYNYTGLVSEDKLVCQWRDLNGVGYSPWSANATGQTYLDISSAFSFGLTNVGDVVNGTGILNITAGNPLPVTIDLLEFIINGTVVGTSTPSDSFNIENKTITPLWHPVTNDYLNMVSMNVTITNGHYTHELESSNSINFTREYDPSYFPAETSGSGNLNYTITRDLTDMTLKMNRDLGGTWKAECLYQTLTQALGGNGEGTWNNQTVIGYYQDVQSIPNTETRYITCYNDDLLFTTTTYSNSTNSLVEGLVIFDDLGGLFGAPAVMLIILAVATMATGRTAPTILVILLTVIGIVGALGMLVLDAQIWGLLVVAGAIGIFQLRRMF